MGIWWVIIGLGIGLVCLGIYSMCAVASKMSRQEEQKAFLQEDLSEDIGLGLK